MNKSDTKYLRRLEGKIRKNRIKNNYWRKFENGLGNRREREREKINLKWYGHLIRMNNARKTKVFEARPEGRRIRERSGNIK